MFTSQEFEKALQEQLAKDKLNTANIEELRQSDCACRFRAVAGRLSCLDFGSPAEGEYCIVLLSFAPRNIMHNDLSFRYPDGLVREEHCDCPKSNVPPFPTQSLRRERNDLTVLLVRECQAALPM